MHEEIIENASLKTNLLRSNEWLLFSFSKDCDKQFAFQCWLWGNWRKVFSWM